MTDNRRFKRLVRARAAKTGESYMAALRHLRAPEPDEQQKTALRIAVCQTGYRDDPSDEQALRTGGEEIRALMRRAKGEGARLAHFPEGALVAPNKRVMSSLGRRDIGPSDWSRCRFDVIASELRAIAALSAELGLSTVLGAPHRLTPPHRPHNSLYVISDKGRLVTRYDERMLSHTKLSFMYSPGGAPQVFTVDGLRLGLAMGMETHYPELFMAYEAQAVDAVLFSTTGEIPDTAPPFAAEALGHAASNSFWVSYSAHAPQSPGAPAGLAGPDGRWAALCGKTGEPDLAVADITRDPDHPARPWRRKARADLYAAAHPADDPRSGVRTRF
ncbi:carbon-nitrogen hydrolase family protein [Rhizobium sp. FKL33]|uniref:carbon-nitrogen hydrolase family protein n=1 Tax=Rhizobium sp. FKL33 TaxID=2562307 RepID=UPI0010C10B3B|nr:carbon-nitrogen hydrolase family protein [Rhizobium sp. FKL33]